MFMILFSILIIFSVLFVHLYKPEKICTTVTKQGHLYWNTTYEQIIHMYFGWGFLILLPLLLYWNTSILLLIILITIPTFGFITGLRTDSKSSVWCFYTSYTSIISIIACLMQMYKIYDFFPVKKTNQLFFKRCIMSI
jgi:hypothetical protein